MENSKLVAVVIPVYSEQPPSDELASFRNCREVLNKHDAYLLCSPSLDTSRYESIYPTPKRTIPGEWFSSYAGYNRLMKQTLVYELFSDYKYILIHQLDAWVFRDELVKWCEAGYDMIGAPWFYKCRSHDARHWLWEVGNGGFALRNTLAFRNAIRPNEELFNNAKHEDIVFSLHTDLSRPTPVMASRFAFELSPSYLYHLNGNRLPFGCHAWKRYEYNAFWKHHIQIQ